MSRQKSLQLFERARRVIPGGVNSPVRAFRGVGGSPIFFESGSGARLRDVDGNEYIDYVSSWGPMLQGFGFDPVTRAVVSQAARSTSFGAPTEVEIKLAELVSNRIPSIEKVRMCNSGTEATMSAIRLARGVTGRDRVVKFQGCFHGHGDSLLVKAGSGVLTLGLPDSPGVPSDLAQHTLTLPFNDSSRARQLFEERGQEIACVIVEPIAGNMGCIPPLPGFLETLRDCTSQSGSLLIFDEVMTGFRVALGGAQELLQVEPDITTLGKVIGGGLPVGAFGGPASIMDHLAPDGPVYQSGTLSGNPLAMEAGFALLDSLDGDFYDELKKKTDLLVGELKSIATKHSVQLATNSSCGMFSLFFTEQPTVSTYEHVAACDSESYAKFFHAMLTHGIYFAPSAFESAFIGGAHGFEEIDQTLLAVDEVFRSWK